MTAQLAGLVSPPPTRARERALYSHNTGSGSTDVFVAGIDEAGVGAIAGPVVAAAVQLPADFPDDGGSFCRECVRPSRSRANFGGMAAPSSLPCLFAAATLLAHPGCSGLALACAAPRACQRPSGAPLTHEYSRRLDWSGAQPLFPRTASTGLAVPRRRPCSQSGSRPGGSSASSRRCVPPRMARRPAVVAAAATSSTATPSRRASPMGTPSWAAIGSRHRSPRHP